MEPYDPIIANIMNQNAIKQAKVRYLKAENAIARLNQAAQSEEMEVAWSDFLSAASTIYSKLEQGSKTNGASTAWFGRKKKERKDDQLLSYIHHARNSDEHGLNKVTDAWVHHNFIGMPGGLVSVAVPEGETFIPLTTSFGGGPEVPLTTYQTHSIRLVTVVDSRYGDSFDPPKLHLGNELPERLLPQMVGELALEYLKNLIEEASSLPQ